MFIPGLAEGSETDPEKRIVIPASVCRAELGDSRRGYAYPYAWQATHTTSELDR